MTTMRRLATLGIVALIFLALGQPGRAAFAVKFYEDGNQAAGHVVEATTASGGTIGLSGSYAAVPDFTFTGLTVTSNAGNAGVTAANLTLSGTITPNAAGHTLTIVFSDDGFLAPAGPNYSLASSESFTRLGSMTAADTYKYQSFATPGAALYGQGTPSPGYTFTLDSRSGSHDEAATPFSSSSVPFTLTGVVTFASTTGAGSLNPTASATLNAVPEPTAVALTALGGLGLLAAFRRRRPSAA